ncbi:MAG TPA: TRAP transporter TatT component family protein, partial [Blastocatellia bacterium]|nr:TRAP transporter TatT component family protein [Blastocatellia bacterium]
LALFAEAAGGLRAARAVLRARKELKRAASLDEAYHGGGPLRVLGRLEHKAPWFIGGSRSRSRVYFERALALAPTNSVTALYAAELAQDSGRRDDAVRLLERIIDAPIDPDWEFENLRDRKRAAALLERLNAGRRA